MRLSRDEAREVAAVAIALAIGLRVASGVVQVIDELDRGWTWRSLLGRFLAPIGSTIGMLTLALVLLLVLSPRGAITPTLFTWGRRIALVVFALGATSTLNSLTTGLGSFVNRLWFALINGFAATVLAGAAWWILANFDADR